MKQTILYCIHTFIIYFHIKFYSFLVIWNVVLFENGEHRIFLRSLKNKMNHLILRRNTVRGWFIFYTIPYRTIFQEIYYCWAVHYDFFSSLEGRNFSPVNAMWVVHLTVCINFLGRYGSLIITTILLLANFFIDDDDDHHHVLVHFHFGPCKVWEPTSIYNEGDDNKKCT